MPATAGRADCTSRIASARPGRLTFDHGRVPSGVWSRGAKPVPPVRHDQSGEAVGQLGECAGDLLGAVGGHPVLDHVEPVGGQMTPPALAR